MGPLQSEIVKDPKSRCARAEGFNGLKSAEAFNHNLARNTLGGKRCIVSQEQINAWAHINSLTSCRKTAVKPSSSDTDYEMTDFCNDHRYSKKLDANAIHLNQTQKEYVRYKQSKAWKNLVVYKSGIHSFGLYSSQLINRGTMVVEYVGEIIGQKVADKREKEYEASNRLQYKSACYFFKIDKDNIIDATRKGGIARFVNHSCQPNCVAKIITVRSEKKVVFFATRDINPGEEITYDYHFNSEDEGEKIPCYCNSKNCRQFLN